MDTTTETEVEFTELIIEQEKPFLLEEIGTWFKKIKHHITDLPKDLLAQVDLLALIRKELYEDLNQLQHAALIIKAAENLQKDFPTINKWNWHPKQTYHPDYADLT